MTDSECSDTESPGADVVGSDDTATGGADDSGSGEDAGDTACAEDGRSDGTDDPECEDGRAVDEAPDACNASDVTCCEPPSDECRDDTLSAVPDTGAAAPPRAPVAAAAPAGPSDGGPIVPLPAAVVAPAIPPLAAVPGLGGDTAAVLGMVGGRLADAGTIAHAPLTGSSTRRLDDALERAAVAGATAGALAGVVHEQEITTSVRRHELTQSTIAEATRAEGAAERAVDTPSGTLGTF